MNSSNRSPEDILLARRRCHHLLTIKDARVLILGGSGLIGLHLAAALFDKCELTVTSRSRPSVRFEGARYAHPHGVYDYVIHAAGYASPARFIEDGYRTIWVNTEYVAETIPYATKRYLFLSTSEIYSLGVRHRPREKDAGGTMPDHPRGVYIESKRCGEAICHTSKPGLAVIGRVSSVYGPGVRFDDRRVMSELINSGLQHNLIKVRDSGSAIRRWFYAADAAEMLINILLYGKEHTYNVASSSGVATTVASLAIDIAQQIGGDCKVTFGVDPVAGAPGIVTPDMTRYDKEFGRLEETPFHEGLAETIAWHRGLNPERASAT